MTHTQTQGADGADDAGTEWFWRIVDANGLGNVPSDETEALRLLCTKAAWYDEGQSASTIPPGVRSLLRTARSGLATYGAGAFEGTILQIDAILAYDPIFPAPAATPGVPDSLRAQVAAAIGRAMCECGPGLATGVGCFEKAADAALALIVAQPAGQAGDAGAARDADIRHFAQFVHGAMRAAVQAVNFQEGQRFPPLEDECGQWWSVAEDIVSAFKEAEAPAPNSTRTGAAETEERRHLLTRMRAASGSEDEGGDCSCNVAGGSDAWQLHDPFCAYRVICEAADEIEALAASPEAPSDAGWRERVRHVKRGTEYDVLHRGVSLQVALDRLLPNGREWSKALIEGDRLVIYQGSDGKLWAREESEFDDGRFVSAPVADPAPSGQAEG